MSLKLRRLDWSILGVSALIVGGILSGCAAVEMLPTGPVIDEETREVVWGRAVGSDAEYTHLDGAGEGVPRLPFLVFGLRYDLDVVVVSDHPEWEMHEVARISTPSGSIWVAKDTRASSGDQMLVTGLESPNDWLPEVPLARRHREIEVVKEATAEGMLDLKIRYTNYDGDPVAIDYRGPSATTKTSLRNGSTMGHSRHQVMAVLDLPARDFGHRASVRIAGKKYGVVRAAGLVPMRLALEQTQGGIPEARVAQTRHPDAGDRGFSTMHTMTDGSTVRRTWQVDVQSDRVIARQRSEMRSLEFVFLRTKIGRRAGESRYALELIEARVVPWYERGGRSENQDPEASGSAAFRIRFRPALPDLRYAFSKPQTSRFVMDVGGQRNHAVGDVTVRSTEEGAEVSLKGRAPRWVARRCVTSMLQTGERRWTMTSKVRPC